MLSSLPILPIELYRQIAFDPALSLRDLYALSLTTHALSSEAYSALYNRVELRASHETKLALRTFVESDRVAQMVRELLLRPDEAFRVVFGLATPLMIHAIHRMNNLKALTLGYLWTSNPFGEGPRTSNSVGTSTDVIPGAHDGMHPPSGPSGPRSTAWTRGLHIPFIDTLTIEAPTYRPIRDLFGELPYPLPHLISIRPMHICYIGGIRRVSCERVYGTIPVDVGQDQEESLLSALERLEIADLDSYPTQNNWAPHLTTVSMIVSGGREGYYIPSRTFEYMKGVKKVGPVFCQKLSADFLEEMSELDQLEGIVLILSRISYRDFGVPDIERMRRAATHLLWVALVPSDLSRPGVFTEYTKWARNEGVEGSFQKREAERWFKVNGRIQDWGYTLSKLLDVS